MHRKHDDPGGGTRPGLNHRPRRPHTDPAIVADDPTLVDDWAAALTEARRRWGDRGVVCESLTADTTGHAEVVRLVGHRHDAFAWSVAGWGQTWRAAFAVADAAKRGEVRR